MEKVSQGGYVCYAQISKEQRAKEEYVANFI